MGNIRRSAIEPDPLRGKANGPQHLVTLASIEDDGMGEEIQVVWEIEPGAAIMDRAGLPDPTGFDDPRKLDAFLHAVLWGASSTADFRALQAPYRSGIQIEDYQLDPLVRAVQMPRANLLVADDVGLGKTIETGLIIQEFLTRHRARTVLIICPSALQIQWKDQMWEKFGLDFRIVDSSLLKDLRRRRGIHVNPWTHFPRIITSIDYLKRDRPLRMMREVLPGPGEPNYPRRFDIMVVDEAHNVAPAGKGRYATDSLRTQAIRTLVPHFEHRLFLTATPHNGYLESFTALLELLDNQRFALGVQPDEQQLRTVMVRRLKTELPPHWDGTPRFPERDLKPIKVPYTDQERQIHADLKRYTELRHKRASDAQERFATEFVLKLLKKRLFSSPASFARTLNKHIRSLKEERRTSQPKPSLRLLSRQVDQLEEEFADDRVYEEATEEAVETTGSLFSRLSDEEVELLEEMQRWAAAQSGRPDSKAQKLLDWLDTEIRPDGKWADKRVIIFTEYRDTQAWLYDLLAAQGFTRNDRLMTLYGGMDPEKREEIKAAFQASPDQAPVRILLATDAASEGIDLQSHCSRLIHYEIPWNPNRMEQRNGRVDRYGQKAHKVRIYHFVDKNFEEQRPEWQASKPGDLGGDLEFLYRAVIKLQRMERDLFGKVAPVVASQVEEAMLGRRSVLDTTQAEKEAEPVRRMLKFERDLKRQIERLHERLNETQAELQLSPRNIQDVVEIALQMANQPPLKEAELEGVWPDPNGNRKRCPAYWIPELRGSWADCTQGLYHPHTHERRPVTFDHNVSKGRDDVVLVHLNHRLVQMSLRLLRAEVWAERGLEKLQRATARMVSDAALENPALIAHARLVLTARDGQRLHEEIITAGGEVREGRFRRMNVTSVQDALKAGTAREVPDSMEQRLLRFWPDLRGSLEASLEARMKDRSESLSRQLQERCEKEASDAERILNELREAILQELDDDISGQLELFSSDEREQFERNRGALERRVAEIPEEIEREVEVIRQRFADPEPRMFPVAITWLVPERLV